MSDNNSTSQVIVLSEYEEKQIKNIIAWQSEEPSVFAKASGFLFKPLEFFVENVIPISLIESILDGANFAAKFLADEGDICRDGKVSKIEELQTKNLKLSDELANSVHNWAIGIATAEGTVAGATGAVGIAVDVPALLTLSLRTIHKIGLCYGYSADTPEEKNFVLRILSVVGSNNPQEKTSALIGLKLAQGIIKNNAWKKLNEKFGKAIVESEMSEFLKLFIIELSRQLAKNLSKRKAMQAIPVAGGIIGGAMNAKFVKDVGWAATRTYQKRWLEDNNKWQEIKNL